MSLLPGTKFESVAYAELRPDDEVLIVSLKLASGERAVSWWSYSQMRKFFAIESRAITSADFLDAEERSLTDVAQDLRKLSKQVAGDRNALINAMEPMREILRTDIAKQIAETAAAEVRKAAALGESFSRRLDRSADHLATLESRLKRLEHR